ncbi:hypothetical protein ABZ897_01165 [Nonomuraea sp. NPDC046802]|uniref:hypothetical protein n=1 Tax=Nonomuraea sp. NPDC046802 TaxID=3154919 RepID=UPI0033E06086
MATDGVFGILERAESRSHALCWSAATSSSVSSMGTPEKDAHWRVIATDLRAAILDGYYPPGGAMPSKPELVGKYDVSRPTTS